MTFSRLSQRTNLWMRQVNTWLSEEELEQINKVKGDVSVSLWIRRQIRNALAVEGDGLPAKAPQPTAAPIMPQHFPAKGRLKLNDSRSYQ